MLYLPVNTAFIYRVHTTLSFYMHLSKIHVSIQHRTTYLWGTDSRDCPVRSPCYQAAALPSRGLQHPEPAAPGQDQSTQQLPQPCNLGAQHKLCFCAPACGMLGFILSDSHSLFKCIWLLLEKTLQKLLFALQSPV